VDGWRDPGPMGDAQGPLGPTRSHISALFPLLRMDGGRPVTRFFAPDDEVEENWIISSSNHFGLFI
jgi:hypothetical protein